MKNILLPTDFSPNALNAIEYAVQLFKDDVCTFYLLNTYTPTTFSVATFSDGHANMLIEEAARKKSEEGLMEIEKGLNDKFANPKHIFIRLSAFNLFVNEAQAVVKERQIDLIVMGTKGATGAKEIFLGTNTMYTIKKSNCAVVAVPAEFSYEDPNEILFPTDFKFSLQNKYLQQLKSICNGHDSRLNLLNVYLGKPLSDAQRDVKDAIENLFKDNSHDFHTAEYMDIVEAISQFQIKHKVNFLVMVQNKHSFFENLLFKPVIKQMVYHTNLPFMVIPSEELLES